MCRIVPGLITSKAQTDYERPVSGNVLAHLTTVQGSRKGIDGTVPVYVDGLAGVTVATSDNVLKLLPLKLLQQANHF